MTREKEQGNNSIEKRVYIQRKIKKRRKELQKEVFSADLAIVFVLVTVLSVPYSFGGLSWLALTDSKA